MDLIGIDLFVGSVPRDNYHATEISALGDLLARGGRILFVGENGLFSSSNNVINKAIGDLGGGMFSDNVTYDTGFHDATAANGQLLPHFLTAGVDLINYAAPAGIGGVAANDRLCLTTKWRRAGSP